VAVQRFCNALSISAGTPPSSRDDFTGRPMRHGITIGMDGKGRCIDNIFCRAVVAQPQIRRGPTAMLIRVWPMPGPVSVQSVMWRPGKMRFLIGMKNPLPIRPAATARQHRPLRGRTAGIAASCAGHIAPRRPVCSSCAKRNNAAAGH
jgi:hypothetical protein